MEQDGGEEWKKSGEYMVANKERLDVAVVRRGLAPSRERARALIMAGQVYVGDRLMDKPGMLVPLDAECRLAESPEELKYVRDRKSVV